MYNTPSTLIQSRADSAYVLLYNIFCNHNMKKFSKMIEEFNINHQFQRTWMISKHDIDTILSRMAELGEVSAIDSTYRYSVRCRNFYFHFDINTLDFCQQINIRFFTPFSYRETAEKIVLDSIDDIIIKLKGSIEGMVEWHFMTKNGLDKECTREKFDDVVLPEAYPFIDMDSFIENYINNQSSILLLMGMQGTGKTRLIRKIVQSMGEKKNPHSGPEGIVPRILYTTDLNAIANEELYINFRCHEYDFMVLEDIDNQLISRTQGNNIMHKFLASSDGFLASRKKIILSTNLKLDEIDPALIRPGRCYAALNMRKLDKKETLNLLNKLIGKPYTEELKQNAYTLAEIYNLAFHQSSDILDINKPKIGFHK